MKRYLIIILAIAMLWSISLVRLSLAGAHEGGERPHFSTLIQERDCKGDKKDDC